MNKKIFLLFGGLIFTALFVLLFMGGNKFFDKKEGDKQTIINTLGEEDIILPPLETILGQNFVVGIPGRVLDEETKNFLQKIKPAGVILYYRNYQTYDQLKNLIAELQEFAKTTTGQSYFIMIDEEPGGATRLDLFKNVFDTGMPNWDRIEQDIKEMASVGINVDLAPLVDFPFNEDTFIKERIPAHSPEALTDFNKKFISLLQAVHISATLKHFPGMGVFIVDPHKKLPYVSNNQKIVDESIKLFENGINAGANFVMTGHGVYDDIDPNVPATLSKRITTDILRGNLGFKGLTITDDLSDMPFIIGKKIDLTEATAESLKAGHNLVIFSHRPDKMIEVFDKLFQQIQNDIELKSIAEKNYRKVVFFKQENF
jgi:beta-N-acetylhexosaminidase